MAVRARRIERPLPGASCPHLVLTDQGWYVVKWLQNPQNPRVVANEAIASELLSHLGIRRPDWAMVQVDQEVCTRERARAADKISAHIKPGWHFGSEFPGAPDTLSGKETSLSLHLEQIENTSDLLNVLAFDIWVDNVDRRQTILVDEGDVLVAQVIDNGSIFGFEDTTTTHIPRPHFSHPCLPRSLYSNWSFADIAGRIAGTTEEHIRCIVNSTPPEWLSVGRVNIDTLVGNLMQRGRNISELIAQCIECWNHHPRSELDTRPE